MFQRMPKAGRQKCKTWYNEAHRDGGVAPLTRRERNSFNFWKGSEARREEEEERAGQRRVLCLQAEELAREFQQVWQSSSQPDLPTLVQCEDLLDQVQSPDLSLVQIFQDTAL